MKNGTKYDPSIHGRRTIRLQGYDYSQSAAYFVTLVTHARACLFGDIIGLEMRPNVAGKIVQREWERLAQRFSSLELGTFVVMPNHLHGIVIIHRDERDARVGATRLDPSEQASPALPPLPNKISCRNAGSPPPRTGPTPASLGALIGQFKSRVTRRLWRIPAYSGRPI